MSTKNKEFKLYNIFSVWVLNSVSPQAQFTMYISTCLFTMLVLSVLQAIVVLKDDLNRLFDDEEMGGSRADGKPSGHGVALAMHTVWQMKSFEKFIHLPGGNILMDIKCLKPFFGSEVYANMHVTRLNCTPRCTQGFQNFGLPH